MSNLQERYLEVKDAIKKSAAVAGNKPASIKLVVVTKAVDVQSVRQTIELGAKDFGENRVQDFMEKYEIIEDKVDWHFIGYLQTNKVKYLVNKVKLIHSLDRISLAEEMNRLGKLHDYSFNCLVQVNVSGENSKFGIEPRTAEQFLSDLSKFEHIKVKGLMTMAPFSVNPQKSRYVFEGLRKIMEHLNELHILEDNQGILSMGMSNDFRIALEEGSNMVRIGSAIYGTD